MLAAYWLAVSGTRTTTQETDPLPVATKLAVVDLDVGTIVKVGNELELLMEIYLNLKQKRA